MSREAHVLVLREPQGEIPWGYSPGKLWKPTVFNNLLSTASITAQGGHGIYAHGTPSREPAG
jgi:hypothetical protein